MIHLRRMCRVSKRTDARSLQPYHGRSSHFERRRQAEVYHVGLWPVWLSSFSVYVYAKGKVQIEFQLTQSPEILDQRRKT